jgi:hypothetical protein
VLPNFLHLEKRKGGTYLKTIYIGKLLKDRIQNTVPETERKYGTGNGKKIPYRKRIQNTVPETERKYGTGNRKKIRYRKRKEKTYKED